MRCGSLHPPAGGRGSVDSSAAPSVAVVALVSAPPSVGPASRGSGTVPARGGVASASDAPTVPVDAPRSSLAGSSAEGTSSLGSIEKKEMAAAVACAEAVFVEFGEGTARHWELGRVDGMQELMRQCIRTRCRNPRGLRARVRLARAFLCHVRGLGLPLTEIPEHVVAAWVNVQRDIARSRGPAAVYAFTVDRTGLRGDAAHVLRLRARPGRFTGRHYAHPSASSSTVPY